MAEPRREWFDALAQIFAAACGVELGGNDVLPYDPRMLEAMAQSGLPMGG